MLMCSPSQRVRGLYRPHSHLVLTCKFADDRSVVKTHQEFTLNVSQQIEQLWDSLAQRFITAVWSKVGVRRIEVKEGVWTIVAVNTLREVSVLDQYVRQPVRCLL